MLITANNRSGLCMTEGVPAVCLVLEKYNGIDDDLKK